MGDAEWRTENEWPLARTDYRRLYLHGQGDARTVAGNGTASFDHHSRNRRIASCTTLRTRFPPSVDAT